MLAKEAGDAIVPEVDGVIQRRVTLEVLRVHLRGGFEQHGGHGAVAVRRREHHRGAAVAVTCLDRCTAAEERADDLALIRRVLVWAASRPALGRVVQRRLHRGVEGIHVDVQPGQEELDERPVPELGSIHQRRLPANVGAVGVRALRRKKQGCRAAASVQNLAHGVNVALHRGLQQVPNLHVLRGEDHTVGVAGVRRRMANEGPAGGAQQPHPTGDHWSRNLGELGVAGVELQNRQNRARLQLRLHIAVLVCFHPH
mmetsp:Transcript_18025/g.51212  ORF Transcript_18025/g.51212 Transcript_18025/m.51212 type:complete len:256 (+) Transcript_18025:77-844(+)